MSHRPVTAGSAIHRIGRAALVLILALPAGLWAADELSPTDFFNTKVHPILATTCFECHGPKKQKGKLRLDSAAAVKKGGENGVVVVPGLPEKSVLITAINYTDPDMEMPPKKKLSAEQIATLTAWVKMGAPWVDLAPGDDGKKGVTPAIGAGDGPEEGPGHDKPPFVGRLHPLVVHFPIACVLLAMFAELLVLWLGSGWHRVVAFLVVIGLASSIAAVVSGLYFMEEPASDLVLRHRTLGWCALVATAVATIALVVSSHRPTWRWTLRVSLLIAAILVSFTGHVGGQMVYGMHFMW